MRIRKIVAGALLLLMICFGSVSAVQPSTGPINSTDRDVVFRNLQTEDQYHHRGGAPLWNMRMDQHDLVSLFG